MLPEKVMVEKPKFSPHKKNWNLWKTPFLIDFRIIFLKQIKNPKNLRIDAPHSTRNIVKNLSKLRNFSSNNMTLKATKTWEQQAPFTCIYQIIFDSART
jgi:hypothetical protein